LSFQVFCVAKTQTFSLIHFNSEIVCPFTACFIESVAWSQVKVLSTFSFVLACASLTAQAAKTQDKAKVHNLFNFSLIKFYFKN
jgi:hypothetical protein